jgi:hypothetical protein
MEQQSLGNLISFRFELSALSFEPFGSELKAELLCPEGSL